MKRPLVADNTRELFSKANFCYAGLYICTQSQRTLLHHLFGSAISHSVFNKQNVTAFTICHIHMYIKENNAANRNIIKKLKYGENNILYSYINNIVLFGIESICARSSSNVNYNKRDNENSN